MTMNKTYTIDEIKARVAPIAKQYGLSHAWLFGSYARGEATEESDVDICIDDGGNLSLFGLSGLYLALKDSLKAEIDIVSEGADENDKRFWNNIHKERVAIYG
jgi:predicted nucleotidyltransferase